MKTVYFKRLILVSTVLKKSREIKFDDVTVITGDKNTTGKSSIIKSLYYTLGANVVFEDEWLPLEVKSILEFTFEGKTYTAFRDGSLIAFFDAKDEVLISTESITKELAPFVSMIFDFNLPLVQSSTNQETQAIPAFLYLPFYIDQDQGWNSYFSSFLGLQMFSRWQDAFKNYHTGIKPKEFYELGNLIKSEQKNERDLFQEAGILLKTKQKVEQSLEVPGIILDIEELRKQLQPLLDDYNILLSVENEIRDVSIRNIDEQSEIRRQIIELEEQISNNENELGLAEKFSEVVCPRCGSIHESKLYHEYALTSDTIDAAKFLSDLNGLLITLKTEKNEVEHKYQIAREQSNKIRNEIANFQTEISLQEALQTVAKKRALEVFDFEISENENRQVDVAKEIGLLESNKKKLLDKKRTKEIKDYYVKALGNCFHELSVESSDLQAYRSNFTPPLSKLKTGSRGARQILALYYAFIDTAYRYSSTAKFPIVVDSPKQQEQDSLNSVVIAEFCIKNRPDSAQLILATLNYNPSAENVNIIRLNEKKGLMTEENYVELLERVLTLNQLIINHKEKN